MPAKHLSDMPHRLDHPGRPSRLGRVLVSDPLYFVTCCAFDRQRVLASDWVHAAFLDAAGRIGSAGNAIGRYVIMPDHIHFFTRIGPGGRLGSAVKCMKERITKAIRSIDPDRTVWQEGFFDHLLRSDDSYAEKWEYVRNNPVRQRLVAAADAWPYQGEVVRIDRV